MRRPFRVGPEVHEVLGAAEARRRALHLHQELAQQRVVAHAPAHVPQTGAPSHRRRRMPRPLLYQLQHLQVPVQSRYPAIHVYSTPSPSLSVLCYRMERRPWWTNETWFCSPTPFPQPSSVISSAHLATLRKATRLQAYPLAVRAPLRPRQSLLLETPKFTRK